MCLATKYTIFFLTPNRGLKLPAPVTVFWDVTPCTLIKENQLRGVTTMYFVKKKRFNYFRAAYEIPSATSSVSKNRLCFQTYDMIYLLTAIQLPPGGGSAVHIYTQTIHGRTQ